MKKDAVFSALILIVGVLLFLLKATSLTALIALSVIGLVLLVVYDVMAKKGWKKPALEILMCVFYAIALISGVVIMNVEGVVFLVIAHKVCVVLFVVQLVVLFALKRRSKAK